MATIEELTIQCHLDSLSWFPEQARDLLFMTVAVTGELGEFANILKKCERGSLEFTDPAVRQHLSEELTDVLIYLMNCAAILNVNMEAVYAIKRARNIERFGQPDHAAAIEKIQSDLGDQQAG